MKKDMRDLENARHNILVLSGQGDVKQREKKVLEVEK